MSVVTQRTIGCSAPEVIFMGRRKVLAMILIRLNAFFAKLPSEGHISVSFSIGLKETCMHDLQIAAEAGRDDDQQSFFGLLMQPILAFR